MPVNKKWKESDVIAYALGERSLREGARWLNEKLPELYQRTHASLDNWLNEVHPVPQWYIEKLVEVYPAEDERHTMGRELIEMRAKALEAAVKAVKAQPVSEVV